MTLQSLISTALALGALLTATAHAQSAPEPAKGRGITLELNKLEPATGGCRAYFVVENRTAEAVKELRLDTFIFDGNGLIARRIGLTFPDLRPDRTKVVPFDLTGAACPEIGRMLVNDVLACTNAAGGPVQGCGELLAVATRSSAKFEY
ncbi:MAG: hypothetical protein JWR08_1227 [Enterovirga sp.]|nr:hypothetical protein [Enterovirga sp.]